MNTKQKNRRLGKYATEKRSGSIWAAVGGKAKIEAELQRLAKQPITNAERRAFNGFGFKD